VLEDEGGEDYAALGEAYDLWLISVSKIWSWSGALGTHGIVRFRLGLEALSQPFVRPGCFFEVVGPEEGVVWWREEVLNTRSGFPAVRAVDEVECVFAFS
jgi:hypothetical protein